MTLSSSEDIAIDIDETRKQEEDDDQNDVPVARNADDSQRTPEQGPDEFESSILHLEKAPFWYMVYPT